MIDNTIPVAARGRPRDERADRAIIAATLELMAEHGVNDLRTDDVADRARVGKATIYRRYRSKEELVAAAVGTLVSEITIPAEGSKREEGSTREDLLVLMRGAVELYSASVAADLMPSLVAEMRKSPELARTVREGLRCRASLRAS